MERTDYANSSYYCCCFRFLELLICSNYSFGCSTDASLENSKHSCQCLRNYQAKKKAHIIAIVVAAVAELSCCFSHQRLG